MAAAEDPGRDAWMLLFQLFRSNRREMAALHCDFDLNPAQAHLLLSLEPGRAEGMGLLAEALACDASYVTGIVDRLGARGLVERLPNPEDRRVKLIRLTAAGEALRTALFERVSQPPPFIAALSHADKTALREIFQRAADAAHHAPHHPDKTGR
jgi:DNA-binding MarR family transcriptional regulator